jgi:hypothetical protein
VDAAGIERLIEDLGIEPMDKVLVRTPLPATTSLAMVQSNFTLQVIADVIIFKVTIDAWAPLFSRYLKL